MYKLSQRSYCLAGFVFASPSLASEIQFHLKIANMPSVNLVQIKLIYIPLCLKTFLITECGHHVPLLKLKIKPLKQQHIKLKPEIRERCAFVRPICLFFVLFFDQRSTRH